MKHKKKYLIRRLVIFGTMFILLLAVIFFINLSLNATPDSIALFNSSGKVFVSSDKNTIDGSRGNSESNSDGTKSAILTNYVQDLGGTLWYVTLKSKIKIADNVIYFKNSDSGKGIAYLKSSTNDYKELYLYDTSKKKSTLITNSAYFNEDDSISKNICVSPNGKAVGYIADYGNYADAKISGRLKQIGQPEVVFEDSYCVAIANDAKYVYFVKQNNDTLSLAVRSGKTDTMLIPNMQTISTNIFLNEDFSQCVFSFDGVSYISKNGKTKEKYADTEVFSFVLSYTNHRFNFYDTFVGFFVDSKPLKNFSNAFFTSPNKRLLYINNNYEVTEITGNILDNSILLAINKGKTIVFLDKSNFLCSVTKDSDSKKTLAQDAIGFEASHKSNTVYFVTTSNELWCVKGSSEPKMISEDVLVENLFVNNYTNTAFFLSEYNSDVRTGTLYTSKNGGKAEKIETGVGQIDLTEKSAFYRKLSITGNYDLYKSDGNSKFKKIAENVN